MFEHGFPSHWTLLDKLIWLRASAASGGTNWATVSGVSPLALANAAAKRIQSLIQYGKCTTSGGDIYCNNGKLVAVDDELPAGYKRITSIDFDGDFWYETGDYLTGDDDVTMTLANTSTTGQNVFGSYNGTASGRVNFSLYIYGSVSTSSSYFRYGDQLVRPKLGSGERTITFGKSGTSGFATDVSVTPDTFETPANTYIGMLPNSSSPTYTGSIIGNILVGTRLKYIPCERQSDGAIGYYEAVKGAFIEPSGTGTPVKGSYDTSHENTLAVVGTPEVITITESGVQTQTATAVNLFATDNVADEQDIITGIVTRKTEVVISNGVITIQALAEPVIEQVTPQPLSTVDGNNTLSWVAEVSGKTMEVTYAKGVWSTVEGYSSLNLPDAVGGKLKSLVQHGKCEVSGTDITCNNGTLGVGPVTSNLLGGEALADYICSKIPTAVKDTQAKTVLIPKGKYCGFPSSVLHYEAETTYTFIDKYDNGGGYYGGANYSGPEGSYNYQEANPEPGTIPSTISVTWAASITIGVPVVTERHVCNPGSGNIISYISVKAPSSKPVLLYYENCGFFKGDVQIADFEPYVEGIVVSGTPEVITLTDANSDTQTASAANLFAVGNIYDEQDIVKGKIIRRTEAVVSDGTTPTESYIGTPAAGNILVKVRSEPVTESVTAQPLTASAGTNTITVTAEVDDIDLVAKYKVEE